MVFCYGVLFRCLDACGCGKISDRGVGELAKELKNLKILDVSSTKVTSKRYVVENVVFRFIYFVCFILIL